MRVHCAPALLCTEQFTPAFKFPWIIAIPAVIAGRKFGPSEILSENPPVVLKTVSISAVILKTANNVAALTVALRTCSAITLLPK
jgi:hypothetical protein